LKVRPRPLTPEEQHVYDAVAETAANVIDAGEAELRTRWWPEISSPDFVLTPTNRRACQVWIMERGAWNNFGFGPEGAGSTFELWARRDDDRHALLRECLRAVVEGRFEIELRSRRSLFRRRPLSSWWILGKSSVFSRVADLQGLSSRSSALPLRVRGSNAS
jgi:hypothetical protein